MTLTYTDKVYLASGFHQRYQLRALGEQIEKLSNYEICSSWIWVEGRPERGQEDWEEFAKRIALQNVADLRRADVLIVDSPGINPTNNGGVHTELGFFLALKKLIYLIGPRGNTFHWLDTITQVSCYQELLTALEERIRV